MNLRLKEGDWKNLWPVLINLIYCLMYLNVLSRMKICFVRNDLLRAELHIKLTTFQPT